MLTLSFVVRDQDPKRTFSAASGLRPIICLLISGVTVVITSVGFDPPEAPRLH